MGFCREFTILVTKIIPMNIDKILQIDNILIGKEIVKINFACDLIKCKGACCTLESEYGAPLLKEEISEIENILEIVKSYLPDPHIKEIDSFGFYENKDNDLMIRSFNNRACVFVFYENGIAKCGIEKAFIDGKTDFRKPISCYLFPIRVSDFGGEVLRYEKFEECAPALEKGNEENINLIDFLKEPLIRKYGNNWYLKLKEITEAQNVNT